MKKNKFLIPVFLIAIIVWGVVLIRQQKNIIQYQKEIKIGGKHHQRNGKHR